MRSRTLLIKLLPILYIALCFTQATNSYSQSNANHYQVKKIFIEAVHNVPEEIRIDPYLKVALENRGFETVNAASEADAILSLVNAQGEIVLDGDGSVPHKSIYQYKLISLNKVIWKTRIKFVSKPSVAEENEYVARKIAERITEKFGAK